MGGLSSSHNLLSGPGISVTTHVGGSLTQVKFPSASRGRVGGGEKKEVRDFSKRSRRNLLNYFNSLNLDAINPLPVFITLTYPGTYPKDKETWTEHFNRRFRRRLECRYGRVPVVWRKEFQRRGAPHFHLLVFFDARPSMKTLREFVSRAWYESCGSICPEHLFAGTRVERIRSMRGVTGYAAKYMGKLETLAPGVESPGRFWGRWNDSSLPIEPQVEGLSYEQAVRFRRVLRNYTGVSFSTRFSYPSNLSVYVSYSTTQKLLSWVNESDSIIGSGEVPSSFCSWRSGIEVGLGQL